MCLNSQLKQQLSERWRLRPFRRRPNYKRIRGQNVLYKGNELIENSCNRSAKISYGRSHLRTTECDRRVGSLNVHVWWCQELTPVSNETRNAEGRACESWSSNGSSARVTILPWLLAGTVISWMLRARITFSSSRCIWRRTTASWCSLGAFLSYCLAVPEEKDVFRFGHTYQIYHYLDSRAFCEGVFRRRPTPRLSVSVVEALPVETILFVFLMALWNESKRTKINHN